MIYKNPMLRSLALAALFSAAGFAQAPTVTGVTNSLSYSTTLSPGLVATIFGSNFGTDYTKATVNIGGKSAFVASGGFGVVTGSGAQFDIEIPMELSPGTYSMTVTIGGASSGAFPLTLSAASPAFSSLNASGSGLGTFDTVAGTLLSLAAPATPGQTLTGYAVGLGVTTPATPTGLATASNQVSPLPIVTAGGVACKVLFAGLVTGYAGLYQVNFTLPSSGVQGSVPIVISVGGQSSPSTLYVPIAGLTAVVVNGSFANAGTVAPGSIATIFANNLGSASTDESSGVFPAAQSEGVEVTFNGEGGPIFHLYPSNGSNAQQIDLLVPSDLPTTGTVNVQLTTSSTNYADYTLNMVPASPSMFRFTDPKNGNAYAIVQFVNSAWLVLPVAATADIGLSACTAATSAATECGQPANIGDILVIYLTGLGLATPGGSPTGKPLATGQIPPANGNPTYQTPTLPTVSIGEVTLSASQILYSGLTPGDAGEYQIDVVVPAGVASGDSVPVEVTMMGLSDTANISIQPSRVTPPQ
jgi:uncharacterized protein (TIGR03437 family)